MIEREIDNKRDGYGQYIELPKSNKHSDCEHEGRVYQIQTAWNGKSQERLSGGDHA